MLTFATILGLVFLGIFAIALLIGVGMVIFGDNNYNETKTIGGIVIVAALVLGFVTQFGFMITGYDTAYMHYAPVTGQVQEIANRQISDGEGGMSTRYVVQLDGEAYAIDDTRAALLKVGDTVNLVCVKEFDWGSPNNGYACKWAK